VQIIQQFEGVPTLLLYFMLYTIICAHTELSIDIDTERDKESCCYLMILSNI
jgi:hypothetical protein